MLAPSFRFWPVAPVLETRSLPARSTRLNIEWRTVVTPSTVCLARIESVNTACERELSAFISVEATFRFSTPRSRQRRASSAHLWHGRMV